jgi:cytochrome c oxidase subunit 4
LFIHHALSFSSPYLSTILTMLRSSILRTARPATQLAAARLFVVAPSQTRSAHAVSNPTLANIEKRWESMPPQEQADLWMALRDRMKSNWNEMTMQEKKAGKLPSANTSYEENDNGRASWNLLVGGIFSREACWIEKVG